MIPINEMPGSYGGILSDLGSNEAETICSGNANAFPMYLVLVITSVLFICTEGRRIFFLFCCCCESQLVKSSAKGKNASAIVKRAALPQNARRDCCASVRREGSSSSCMF